MELCCSHQELLQPSPARPLKGVLSLRQGPRLPPPPSSHSPAPPPRRRRPPGPPALRPAKCFPRGSRTGEVRRPRAAALFGARSPGAPRPAGGPSRRRPVTCPRPPEPFVKPARSPRAAAAAGPVLPAGCPASPPRLRRTPRALWGTQTWATPRSHQRHQAGRGARGGRASAQGGRPRAAARLPAFPLPSGRGPRVGVGVGVGDRAGACARGRAGVSPRTRSARTNSPAWERALQDSRRWERLSDLFGRK